METVKLGRTGLEISRLGFGAWAAGGSNWRQGWSGQDDHDSREAIERALELGVNWIDTAPAYGWGHSERIVGDALRGASQRPLLFTKCSALQALDGSVRFSLEPASLRRELEGSLERLGVDRIDLYQIHRPLPELDIERGWQTLVSFRSGGPRASYRGVEFHGGPAAAARVDRRRGDGPYDVFAHATGGRRKSCCRSPRNTGSG